MKHIIFLTSLLLLLSLPVSALDNPTPVPNAGFSPTYSVSGLELEFLGTALWNCQFDEKTANGFVYRAMINGLQIVDIQDPAHPAIVSQFYTGVWSSSVFVDDTIAYLGTRGSGLFIFSVADPVAPAVLGRYETPGTIADIEVVDSLAFLATGADLQVIDISAPASPVFVGEQTNLTVHNLGPRELKVHGDYVYVSGFDLWILDISALPTITVVDTIATFNIADDIEIKDTLLFLADNTIGQPSTGTSLLIYDIANPESPALVSQYDIDPELDDIEIAGDYIYLSMADAGYAILDISNPVYPELVRCLPLLGDGRSMSIDGDLAILGHIITDPWVVDGSPGPICDPATNWIDSSAFARADTADLVIFDISDPLHPTVVGSLPSPGFISAVATGVNCVVIGDEVLGDITRISTNPFDSLATPTAFRFPATPSFPSMIQRIEIRDSLIFATDMYWGLRSANMSNPDSMYHVGTLRLGLFTRELALLGNYAFVASDEVYIVDISDPANMFVVGTLSDKGESSAMTVAGSCVYIVDSEGHGQVVDCSGAKTPQTTNEFTTIPCRDVAASGELLTVQGAHSVEIFDISSPSYPVLLSSYDAGAEVQSVILSGDWLVVGTSDAVHVLDLFNPLAPLSVYVTGTTGPLRDLALGDDNCLYVADHFSLYRFRMPTPTSAGDTPDPTPTLPDHTSLHQNYPNPFNPTTTIEYDLPKQAHVSIDVFNVLGQRVRSLVDKEQPAGAYRIEWDGLNDAGVSVATGVYFYRLTAGDQARSQKMVLVR